MAEEKITANEFIDPTIRKEFEALNKEVLLLIKNTTQLLGSMKPLYEEMKKGATTQKEVADNVKKTHENTSKLSDVEKEIQKIEEQHYKVLTKMVAQRSEEAKKLQEATERAKKENLERKSSIETTEGYRAKIALLRAEKDKLIITDKNYQKNLDSINKKIDDHQKVLDKAKDSDQKRAGDVGKYREALNGLVGSFALVGAAIASLVGLWDGFKKIMDSTNATGEALEFRMFEIKGAFDSFLRTIAEGDWSNLFKNMDEAEKAAGKLIRAMDFYDHQMKGIQVLNAEEATQLFELQAIYKNTANAFDVRKKALDEYVSIKEKASKREVDAEQKLNDRLTKNFIERTKLTKDELRNFIVLFSTQSDALQLTEKIAFNEEQLAKVKEMGWKVALENGVNRAKEEEKFNSIILKQKAELEKLLEGTGFTQEKIMKIFTADLKLSGAEINNYADSLTRLASKNSEFSQTKAETAKMYGMLSKKEAKEEQKDIKDVQKEKEENEKKSEQFLQNYLKRENEKRKIENDFADYVIEQQNKKAEKIEKTEEEITENIIKNEKEKTEAVKKAEEEKQQAREESQKIAIESSNILFDITSSFRDREIQGLEESREKELLSAGDNAKKKERIEAEYNKKIADIKKKQAIADKVQALFNMSMNTQVAVSKTLATAGWLGIPLTTWIKIQGALQTAAVLAQPIPKFFKGVKGLKNDTLGIVGDKAPGRSGDSFELIETPNAMFLSPNQATTMALPKGTNVYTHEETIKMMGGMQPEIVQQLIKEQRLTRKVLANQTHNSTTLTQDGLEFARIKGNSRTKMIDKYFRT